VLCLSPARTRHRARAAHIAGLGQGPAPAAARVIAKQLPRLRRRLKHSCWPGPARRVVAGLETVSPGRLHCLSRAPLPAKQLHILLVCIA